MKKIKVVNIIGPTAVGKTKLALELSKKFDVEIISADSIQIYKEFNILSAKPTDAELQNVPHHFINSISVEECYSVADFVEQASKCISQVDSNNRLPLLVGGTGLYVDSLLKNISFSSKSTSSVTLDAHLSNCDMMDMLKKVDPQSAAKIHINDSKRLRRALEFYETHGYPISKQVEDSKKAISPFDTCRIGLSFLDRELLYSKINLRVDEMFQNGILEEVQKIYSSNNVSKTACAAIGYKEILQYLKKEKTLQNVMDEIKQATRRYAKRQLTWFRRDTNINWVYLDEFGNFSEVVKQAEKVIKKFLCNE